MKKGGKKEGNTIEIRFREMREKELGGGGI